MFVFLFFYCVLDFLWFSLQFSRSLIFVLVLFFVNMVVFLDFSFDFHFHLGFVFNSCGILVV